MSSLSSPFYVDGPIDEQDGKGKFQGANGSRRENITNVASYCTTQDAIRRTTLFVVEGLSKVGKTSTIIYTMQDLPTVHRVVPLEISLQHDDDAVSRAIGMLNILFGESREIREQLESKRLDATRTRGQAHKYTSLNDALRIITEHVNPKKNVFLLKTYAWGDSPSNKELIQIMIRMLEIPAVFITETSKFPPDLLTQSGSLGYARLSIKKIRVGVLNESEAFNFPCGKNDSLPRYCYFYGRPSNTPPASEGFFCRLSKQKLPDEAFCHHFRKIILEHVGCHPFLLARICKEIENKLNDISQRMQTNTDKERECETFIKSCLLEDDIITAMAPIIDSMLESLGDNLRDSLKEWLWQNRLPEEAILEQFRKLGLVFKLRNEWIIPLWIKDRIIKQGGHNPMDITPFIPVIVEATKFVLTEVSKWISDVRQRAAQNDAPPVGTTLPITLQQFLVIESNPTAIARLLNQSITQADITEIQSLLGQLKTRRKLLLELESQEITATGAEAAKLRVQIQEQAREIINTVGRLVNALARVYRS